MSHFFKNNEYISNNGDKYTGEFLDDKFHGYGEFTTPENKMYGGNWEEGDLFSKGDGEDQDCTIMFPNGAKYIGGVKNFIQDGKGVL